MLTNLREKSYGNKKTWMKNLKKNLRGKMREPDFLCARFLRARFFVCQIFVAVPDYCDGPDYSREGLGSGADDDNAPEIDPRRRSERDRVR